MVKISEKQNHRRFTQQAGWTRSIRRFIYQRTGLDRAGRVLEVGCGEGVILADLQQNCPGKVFGLDIRMEGLKFTQSTNRGLYNLTNADIQKLPYASGVFDITCCHFTLLWIQETLTGLKEMQRVTRPGGWVAVLAEPDYGGRIDFPEPFQDLGRKQAQVLKQHGANPNLGRELSFLLNQSGLKEVEVGVLGGMWGGSPDRQEWEEEWATLESDLGGQFDAAELEKQSCLDWESRLNGERILYVPTFYGWGKAV